MNLRVVNNNTPGWTLIVETAPNVTLDVGTELVVADPVKRAYALLWSVMTDDRRVHEARRLLLGTLTKEQQHAALAGGAEPKHAPHCSSIPDASGPAQQCDCGAEP